MYEFTELRKNGVYVQRGEGIYMVRTRIPAGGLTSGKMLKLAELSEKYCDSTLHITTRQNMEFHFVEEENLPGLLIELELAGITTRGTCGNTIRNVTACPLSGFCKNEVINAEKTAREISVSFAGNPDFENLPRKFKISVSGCKEACALPEINDIGLVARKGSSDKTVFEVYIAGGLGRKPSMAVKLFDKIEAYKIVPLIQVILEVFNKYGDRGNFATSRMKFLLARFGHEKFKRIILENFNPDWII